MLSVSKEMAMALALVAGVALTAQAQTALAPAVIAEETVATCLSPNNGAGPLWCYGAPLVFRSGDSVFVSVMETGEGVEPLCNTRWRVFHRGQQGWRLVRAAEGYRLREPSPLAGLPEGPLFLSITPSTEPPGTQYGRCETQLLVFDLRDLAKMPEVEKPKWSGDPYFTDHSYRGFAADGVRRELLWLNIDAKTSVQHWSFRDAEGYWTRQGGISFPVRACYPQVALSNRSAHVLAIGDIVEPIEEWREYKFAQSGRSWDYVFRRLFYAYTSDVTQRDFGDPLEIDTVESSAGHITNLDLWIGPDGSAHVLYLKSNVQSAVMRDRYSPGLPILRTLEYTVLKEGKIVKRETLLVGGEVESEMDPGYGRFHATADGRLWAVCSATKRSDTASAPTLFLMQVFPERDRDHPVEVTLQDPFSVFFTATERGGSRPSNTLDLFGIGRDGQTLQYAEVQLTD